MPGRSPPITPLKLPRRAKHLIIFGGSFDPPHLFHAVEPRLVAARLYGPAGHTLYIPAAQSPLKPAGPVASDDHRLAMLKLSLRPAGPRSIWTDELDRAAWLRARHRERPSYTIDTLRRLRRSVPPGISLRLLIGADQAAEFHRWKNFRSIIRTAEPIVMPRGAIRTLAAFRRAMQKSGAWSPREIERWSERFIPTALSPAASTSLRAAIPRAPRRPGSWWGKKTLGIVNPLVAWYIVEHRLYGHPGPGSWSLPPDSEYARAMNRIRAEGRVRARRLAAQH